MLRIVCALAILVLSSNTTHAQQSDLQPSFSKKTAEEVAAEINSPFCPGRLLRDCPSSGATELREEIDILAAQGMNKDEIKAQLIEKYGDSIDPLPGFGGFGALAWIGPLLFLLLGGWLLSWKLKSSLARAERESE